MFYSPDFSVIIGANSIATITFYNSGFLALIYNYTASILNRFKQSDSCSYNFLWLHISPSSFSLITIS